MDYISGFGGRRFKQRQALDFLETAVKVIAKGSRDFSFAYPKELFIRTLTCLIQGGPEAEAEACNCSCCKEQGMLNVPEELVKNGFIKIMRCQIKSLRLEMDTSKER